MLCKSDKPSIIIIIINYKGLVTWCIGKELYGYISRTFVYTIYNDTHNYIRIFLYKPYIFTPLNVIRHDSGKERARRSDVVLVKALPQPSAPQM